MPPPPPPPPAAPPTLLHPPPVRPLPLSLTPRLSPSPSRRLCSEWGDTGPVALKGVASGADAKQAMETGFGAVWVSNHGGRQLDGALSSIRMLPQIMDAVGGEVEVILRWTYEPRLARFANEGDDPGFASGVNFLGGRDSIP